MPDVICEVCRGSGRIVNPAPHIGARMLLPCPECGGCGIASCCDAAGSAQPVPAWPWLYRKSEHAEPREPSETLGG